MTSQSSVSILSTQQVVVLNQSLKQGEICTDETVSDGFLMLCFPVFHTHCIICPVVRKYCYRVCTCIVGLAVS